MEGYLHAACSPHEGHSCLRGLDFDISVLKPSLGLPPARLPQHEAAVELSKPYARAIQLKLQTKQKTTSVHSAASPDACRRRGAQ